MKHGTRMRVECDSRRHDTGRFGLHDDRFHYPLMPDVQPVKNAQRQDRRPCNIRVLCTVKYFHPLQNGIAVAGIQQARVPDVVSLFHILCEVEQNK